MCQCQASDFLGRPGVSPGESKQGGFLRVLLNPVPLWAKVCHSKGRRKVPYALPRHPGPDVAVVSPARSMQRGNGNGHAHKHSYGLLPVVKRPQIRENCKHARTRCQPAISQAREPKKRPVCPAKPGCLSHAAVCTRACNCNTHKQDHAHVVPDVLRAMGIGNGWNQVQEA